MNKVSKLRTTWDFFVDSTLTSKFEKRLQFTSSPSKINHSSRHRSTVLRHKQDPKCLQSVYISSPPPPHPPSPSASPIRATKPPSLKLSKYTAPNSPPCTSSSPLPAKPAPLAHVPRAPHPETGISSRRR